jgi:hypothetical protein
MKLPLVSPGHEVLDAFVGLKRLSNCAVYSGYPVNWLGEGRGCPGAVGRRVTSRPNETESPSARYV